MSTENTGANARVKYKEHYNLKLKQGDWCNYFKKCNITNNINGSYCWACQYRKPLDIPNLLAERGRE